MRNTLGWIAIVGLSVGAASLALAWTIAGRDTRRLIAEESHFNWRSCDNDKAVGGSERRLRWTGGDTIDVVAPAALRLIPGNGSEVVLRGAPETIAHLRLVGGRLFADCRGLAAAPPIEVELPAEALRHLRLSGSTHVVLEKLDQPALELTISGSGDVRARGSVERLAVTISGSADARLGDLAAKRLKARLSGSGTLEASPQDEADLKVSGSGNVRLLTRPASLHSKVSGSGRIVQPPLESADGRK